jgi:hypothetical protein
MHTSQGQTGRGRAWQNEGLNLHGSPLLLRGESLDSLGALVGIEDRRVAESHTTRFGVHVSAMVEKMSDAEDRSDRRRLAPATKTERA